MTVRRKKEDSGEISLIVEPAIIYRLLLCRVLSEV